MQIISFHLLFHSKLSTATGIEWGRAGMPLAGETAPPLPGGTGLQAPRSAFSSTSKHPVGIHPFQAPLAQSNSAPALLTGPHAKLH